jgi:hypothetical protein
MFMLISVVANSEARNRPTHAHKIVINKMIKGVATRKIKRPPTPQKTRHIRIVDKLTDTD